MAQHKVAAFLAQHAEKNRKNGENHPLRALHSRDSAGYIQFVHTKRPD